MSDAAEILAELCVNAPNPEIRDCLRLYNVDKTTLDNERALNKCQKSTLVSSLEYLQVSDNDYNKEPLIRNLVCRIQNLFPDTCALCGETYVNNVNDSIILPCEICGQDVHRCILQLLGKEQTDVLTAADLMDHINPLKLPGIHYICAHCEPSTIPSKEAGRPSRGKKTSTKLTKNNIESSSKHIHSILSDNEPENDDDVNGDVVEHVTTEITNNATEEVTTHPPSTTEVPGVSDSQDKTQLSSRKPQEKLICRYYKNNNCKYGLKGKDCPYAHPAPCVKLLKHGTRSKNGCNKGKKCTEFHPKMCPTSITKGEFLTQDVN